MGTRVLIVEDNEPSMRLAADVLDYHGYDVLKAPTGARALTLARREPGPSLVLLDLQLPDIDGFAVLAALRAEPVTARIPVVALTAFAMPTDEARCRAAGFDGYLTKPIDVAAFPVQVSGFLA